MRKFPSSPATTWPPIALTTSLVLVACSSASFKPTEVHSFGTPYENLNESSYGPLSSGRFRFCDPADDYSNKPNIADSARPALADATHAIAGTITGAIGAPLQGLTKIDVRIVDLELGSFFKLPFDSNHPPVAVLAHAPDGIAFWHSAKMVRPSEVAAAAQAYCGKTQKNAVYRGSASRCPPTERGLNGTVIIPTYAISAFACTPRR